MIILAFSFTKNFADCSVADQIALCAYSVSNIFFLLIYLLHQATCILGAEIYLLHLITYPSTESGIETHNSISINILHKQQMKQRIELNHPVRKPK